MKLNRYRFPITIILVAVSSLCAHADPQEKQKVAPFKRNIDFNENWQFKRCESAENALETFKNTEYDDAQWEPVTLPHSPRLEPLVVNDQWQGICWYRKRFAIDRSSQGMKIWIEFGAAMQIAELWVNGKPKTTHYGGYLPFTIDITADVLFDKNNLIAVRLDNRDNPEVPPGKPLKELDFCTYGGLYRNVKMHIVDELHITDALAANRVAGGGVFVQYPLVGSAAAQIRVQTNVINEMETSCRFSVITRMFDRSARLVAEASSTDLNLQPAADLDVVQTLEVRKPELWRPDSPHLYELHSIVLRDDAVVDRIETRIGIRQIAFSGANGFTINGVRTYLRGTNYHQEYPYVGYALSDNAHCRDALLIKQAGFDFVRLSHYPHAEAFMDACDELGILVMDSIPGWQFFGNAEFQRRSIQDCRDMIRRDRNHPSVVLWEVSLNESNMSKAFMEETHRIAHAEYPGDQCYTCGWQDVAYDVFIPARQHAKAPDYWKHYGTSKPLFIAEYGDWEYYAQDAGFNQTEFKNLSPDARNSRQLRASGEKRLLQQALNYQEAYNDNLASPAVGSANWLMFDYNRGYADDIEASGIMDIFRLPKPACYFFTSQRPPNQLSHLAAPTGPMVHIATYWTEDSDLRVRVFSNCQRVTLRMNGEDIATQDPDRDAYSNRLRYPPFTFKLDKFQAGDLEAIGFIDGKQAATHRVSTPLDPQVIQLTTNLNGVKPAPGRKDLFFVYASISDGKGTHVPTATDSVRFEISGPGRLVGANPVAAEAGIASILVETSGHSGVVTLGAASRGLSAPKRLQIGIQ